MADPKPAAGAASGAAETVAKVIKEGLNLKQAFLEAVVYELCKHGVSLVKGAATDRHEDAKKRRGDKHAFAQAMDKMRLSSPQGTHAFGVITDFITDDTDPDCLNTDTDRDDFQVNAARTGDTVDDTVTFLLGLAETLPNHAERKRFLNAIGYIGKRSVDAIEHAQNALVYLRDLSAKLGVSVSDKFTAAVDGLDAAVTASQIPAASANLAASGTTAWQRAKDRWRN